MTYTSVNFIFFVLATMLVYFLFPKRNYRWTVLLAASVFFYLVAGYTYAVFILFTALSTFLIGLWIDKISRNSKLYLRDNKKSLSREEKKKYKNKIKIQKRWVMTLALVLNFGILAFLKYYNFFAGSLNDILGSFGMDFSAPTLKLFLPLGISFYTFQSMGYIIDVYRETTPPERNPFKMLLFVSFFPQIIQGPISLHGQLAHQLYEGHEFDFTRFKYGAELIIWGFIKKLIIADRSAILITAVTDNYGSYNGSSLTFTVLLYALQLYADFSGGIDISRGVAQIFGIDMIDNFRRPYFSRSISEYWRRWHISLGAWLKNYLFYPVAMSNFFITAGKNMKKTRFGKTSAGSHISKVLPTSVASLIVFLVVGVWHGADWKYVAFGFWNGMIIMLSILLKPVFESIISKLRINTASHGFIAFQIFRTLIIILVGYVFDVAPDFGMAMDTFVKFFTDQNIPQMISQFTAMNLLGNKDFLVIGLGAVLMLVVSIIQEKHPETTIRAMLDKKPFAVRWLSVYAAIMAIIVFGIYGSGYNAADFVYMQF